MPLKLKQKLNRRITQSDSNVPNSDIERPGPKTKHSAPSKGGLVARFCNSVPPVYNPRQRPSFFPTRSQSDNAATRTAFLGGEQNPPALGRRTCFLTGGEIGRAEPFGKLVPVTSSPWDMREVSDQVWAERM
ncbi:hypothetical protein Bbelb_157180 [Branchiostoma belcheri]|nr:hypothetical protein Bbelb_157180 [Branchiostoma belcheri]